MGKLIKLKGWLTLTEATEYLSASFDETVTEADLLRFVINGHMRLSVNFVNHTHVRFLKPLSDEDLAAHRELIQLAGSIAVNRSRSIATLGGLYMENGDYMKLEEGVSSIDGIWDLAMAGGEALDIRHRLQKLTGGAPVELVSIDGSFVRRGNKICQLVESFDENKYSSGSKAEGEALEAHIHNRGLNEIEAAKLRDDYQVRRQTFVERRKTNPYHENFYPRDGLPEDANLVVEVSALMEFLQTANGMEASYSNAAQKEIEALKAEIEQLKAESRCSLSGQGGRELGFTYITSALEMVSAVQQRYYGANFDIGDKRSYPPKDDIVEWVMEQYGIKKPTANAVERIATPFDRNRAERE